MGCNSVVGTLLDHGPHCTRFFNGSNNSAITSLLLTFAAEGGGVAKQFQGLHPMIPNIVIVEMVR